MYRRLFGFGCWFSARGMLTWSTSIFNGCEPLRGPGGELVICALPVAIGEARESDPGPCGNAAVGLSFAFISSDERNRDLLEISEVATALFCLETAVGLAISTGSCFRLFG